ncbi:hypothetical protein [Schleiferilactobacillus perolens]|jgi:hypothetical protein|uniref:hypothetical protein n=1 Tax=Schleiferilactobacillus perolens TaxID=100468 RepID=UPI002354AAB7|nr:hypothetical protein [Schleiferilactobacillus perolens]MCI2170669.1 hypothetical protein [Schleiferilactobacillus perolens]
MKNLKKGQWVRYVGTLFPKYSGNVYQIADVGWPNENDVQLKLSWRTIIDLDSLIPSSWSNGFLASADELAQVEAPDETNY